METEIVNTHLFYFVTPNYKDKFIAVPESNNSKVAIYNIYSQKIGYLPSDKVQEVITRMQNQKIYITLFFIEQNRKFIFIDINFA